MKFNFNFTINVPRWLRQIILWPVILYYRLRFGQVVRLIHIANFKFAIVDLADYEELRKYPWRLCRSNRTCYAFYTVPRGKNLTQNVFWMHRQIMKPPDWLLVDHGNHNGLDNRRCNLRLANHSENKRNTRKQNSKTSSRFKGVDFVKPTGKWRARISIGHKRLFLGSFTDELSAARAYDDAAKKYFGEFACLNFPESADSG
ncbi:MAG: AP2/ERF family transcription factor [Sedimentisphaerales bacterium]|jgi:hypothetical protein